MNNGEMNIMKKAIVLTMVLLVGFVGLVEAKSAEDYFRSGHTYYKKNDYDKAIQDFSKAIQLNPRTALFYQMRSNAYASKGEYDKAIRDYSKAIQHLPEYYIYYASRGCIYEKTGEYDKAIQDFTKAIQLKPKDADTYNTRGNVYADKGEYNKAIQDYTKAIQLDPKIAVYYNNRGKTYYKKGEYNLALQDYNKAIQLGCKQFWPYDNTAWLYATSPDPEYRNGTKAVELAKKAISIEGEKSRVVATLAASYAEVGQFDDAVKTQKRAIKLAKKENSTYKNAVEAKKHLRSYEQRKPWREYPKQTIIFPPVFLTKNSRIYHKPNCTERASKEVKA